MYENDWWTERLPLLRPSAGFKPRKFPLHREKARLAIYFCQFMSKNCNPIKDPKFYAENFCKSSNLPAWNGIRRRTSYCLVLWTHKIHYFLYPSRKLSPSTSLWPRTDLKWPSIKLFTTNHFTTCWTVGFNRNILNKFISETDFESISTGKAIDTSALVATPV